MKVSDISDIIIAQRFGNEEGTISFLLTDSRSLCFPEDTLFFAIPTQRNDGHRYISDLYRRGVRNFVVQQLPEQHTTAFPHSNFLKVDSSLRALQQLASHHRSEFSIPVIGITGSNGKTTVKEWLYQLLSADHRITRSPRSYNSQIGVPLSVWLTDAKTQLGIFEAGISMPHEMSALEPIIRPTIGIITNIRSAHQENFHSLEEKCMEKLMLMQNSDTVIYNADDTIIASCIAKSSLRGKAIGWSTKDSHSPFYISRIETSADEKSTTIHYHTPDTEGSYTLRKINEGAIENSIICAITCLLLGMNPETLKERMLQLESVAMRLEVKQGQHGCTIINDSYNNDINSLEIALDFMARRPEHKGLTHTLILSDIEQSGMTHEEISSELLRMLHSRGINKFIGIGTALKQHFTPVLCGSGIDILRAFFDTTEDFLRSQSFRNLHDEVILIKGARSFGFERISDRLEQKVHETVLEINLDAVVDNFNRYRSFMHPETKLVCMVKADAYGAGAVEVARTLQDHRVDYLAVAVADEGVILRKAGITANIIVMNPEMSAFRTMFDYNLEPEVYSFRLLDALSHAAENMGITEYPIHVKFDTGMCRLGFHPEHDIDALIAALQKQNAVTPRSVFSHFVGSDSDDFDDFSDLQFSIYDTASRKLQAAFPHRILRHICNSAGIEHFPERQMDMCRLGLGLYGINPRNNESLATVSTLTTTILQKRIVPAGTSVGYSRRTILERESAIAAIPMGYADGLDRKLGNRNGYCLVNGHKAPYVGNICMDVAMIDVTGIPCAEGDKVEIFGRNLPVTELSDRIGTIPYEVLTGISSRVKRIYVKD